MVKKEKIIFPRQHCKEKNVEFITSSQPVLPLPSGHPCTKLWPIIPVQDNFWSWQVSQSFCLFILLNIFFYSCSRFDFWRWSQKQMQICYPDWSVWASCQKHTIKLPTSFPNRTGFYFILPTTTHWSFTLWRAMHSSARLTFLFCIYPANLALSLLVCSELHRPIGSQAGTAQLTPHTEAAQQSEEKNKCLEHVSFVSTQMLLPTSFWNYQLLHVVSKDFLGVGLYEINEHII